jgi:hypothetical protein
MIPVTKGQNGRGRDGGQFIGYPNNQGSHMPENYQPVPSLSSYTSFASMENIPTQSRRPVNSQYLNVPSPQQRYAANPMYLQRP